MSEISPCKSWLECRSQRGSDPPKPDWQWRCSVHFSCFYLHIWLWVRQNSPRSQQQIRAVRPGGWHIWRCLWSQQTGSTWEVGVFFPRLPRLGEMSCWSSVFLALEDQGRLFQRAQLEGAVLNADHSPVIRGECFQNTERTPRPALLMLSSKGTEVFLFSSNQS